MIGLSFQKIGGLQALITFSRLFFSFIALDAKQCAGIDLEWDYGNQALDCSMDVTRLGERLGVHPRTFEGALHAIFPSG